MHADSAPAGKRALAIAIDCLAAAALYWCLVQADVPLVEGEFLLFICTAFVVGVAASAALLPGQSPGKAVARIAVLSSSPKSLTILKQVARDASRVLLAFIGSFAFMIGGIASLQQAFVMSLSCVAVFELVASSVRLDGRSLADILFNTRVVSLPPLQPHRAPAGPMYSSTDAEFGKSGHRPPRDA